MEFAIKFGKMQAIFNAARQAAAQNAENIQQRASKMHFDIKINTPIVAFPRMVITETLERDVMTAYLVEIYVRNEFLPLDDSKNAQTANKLSAGINNVRLTSKFNYAQDKEEELELIDKVDLDFRITTADHESGSKRPDTEIEGSMSNLNLRVTEAQLKFILELTRSIPAAFATEPDEEIEEEVKEEMRDSIVSKAKALTDGAADDEPDKTQPPAHLGPEIGSSDETWTKLDLVSKVGAIGLELISGKPDSPIGDLAPASLSKFSLNETNVKLRMVSDGSMESELSVQSCLTKSRHSLSRPNRPRQRLQRLKQRRLPPKSRPSQLPTLIEPWAVDFHMEKILHPEPMSVKLYSRKSMELTITSATIALA
jgi:vacuolar protein sorting-associated protein 13A/C